MNVNSYDEKSECYKNKDDTIHKSKALKRWDKQTLTLKECQNLPEYKCISPNKIVNKFVASKLNKYRILFKDILTFLGLDYREIVHCCNINQYTKKNR